MSNIQVLASSQLCDKIIARPTTNFHPSIWGDRFLHYNISEQDLVCKQEKVEELIQVVKKEILSSNHDQLKLIDNLQRLGLSHHFESEIEKLLEQLSIGTHHQNHHDLHDASLWFRLLRQHGFNVSSSIFEKFKDAEGNFKKSLITDVSGLLSLYEASHLSYVGESILDEALAFTTTHLKAIVANSKDHPLSHQISIALHRPLRKTIERLHARWWKEHEFVKKFPFARDRMVELYFWILNVYYEPKYSRARKLLTKVIALTSITDDTYDAYGTIDELELLTKAIQRWDINCMDKLEPEYLKTYYKVMLESYEEFEKELKKEELYKLEYAKEEMKRTIGGYFEEARWLNEGYFPSFDEHLRVSYVSSANVLLIATSFVGMHDIVTHETLDWLSKDPKIFEQQRNHIPSTVDCYMKQYGVSEEEAIKELNKRVVTYWKEINEDFIRPTVVPFPILLRVLNFTKVADLLYKEGDDQYTNVGKVLKESIAALLIDSIPL
ncbi:hypothetical protein F8388_020924 [Cannabis sativa]|uniref:Uncharacterized protein n=1 Tax=Cannabis sativa TaxID=3483 RepID=A0A7J6FKP1_CANSA|nr:hypothetical protein F8388_020924 [Cannabis sativa]